MAPERPCPEGSPGVAVGHVFTLNSGAMIIKEEDGTLIEEQVGTDPSAAMIIKEEEGALIEEQVGGEDDDLTSLSWLVQNKNLLKGISLKPVPAQTSPTSDFAEDGSSGSERSDRADSTSSSGIEPSISSSSGSGAVTFIDVDQPVMQSVKTSKLKHPHHIPYDPLVHINSKPPYSFSCLIFMAIEDSPARALPVKEIYAWIQSHFPFYRNAPTGWKNSVRHNLSLNKCFCKVEKAPNLGKGSLWMVDPAFRPNLLQSMSKAPINTLTFLERSSVKSLVNSNGLESKFSGNIPKTMNGSNPKSFGKVSRLPNPELFPFLSRRLAASGVEVPGVNRLGENIDEDSDDEEDEVDAAQAMLSLKHGPRVNMPKTEDIYKRPYARKMNTQRTRKSSVSVPVITSSPSEDHTYSAGANLSPDEAFGEGSDTDEGTEITPGHPSLADESVQSDSEEQRRIAEGAADALLNLAGFRSKLSSSVESTRHRPRPISISEKPSSPKRIRRQRKISQSANSDSSRQQQLRSIRKRERLALERELLDRKNLMKAEILADLAVIRNNNNIVVREVASKGVTSSGGSIQTRHVKLHSKRQSVSSSKPNIDVNFMIRADSGSSVSNNQIDKRINPSQKRKHWSYEGNVRKSRR